MKKPLHNERFNTKRVKDFFKGKTIDRMESESVNVATFYFTDGTKLAIEAELFGSLPLAELLACEVCAD
jgi:hypothetical protein